MSCLGSPCKVYYKAEDKVHFKLSTILIRFHLRGGFKLTFSIDHARMQASLKFNLALVG